MTQLLCHLWGDYLLQSDWMAQKKTSRLWIAYVHALCYSSPFLLLRPSLVAWLAIFLTHGLIDRYRLARYVVWAKNWAGPFYQHVEVKFGGGEHAYIERQWRRKNPTPDFADCQPTGYPATSPLWLSTWLLIIADNILHLTINFFALRLP